jgi:hypothetical protein
VEMVGDKCENVSYDVGVLHSPSGYFG